MNVVKLSFLFQFRRIFESSKVQTICFWSMIYVGLWACAQITTLGISCLPIQYIVPSTAGWCIDTLPVWYFSSAMSLATDFLIFSIPLPSVIRLNLRIRQKFVVVLIFCLGFLSALTHRTRFFLLTVSLTRKQCLYYFGLPYVYSTRRRRKLRSVLGQRRCRHLVRHRTQLRHHLCLSPYASTSGG